MLKPCFGGGSSSDQTSVRGHNGSKRSHYMWQKELGRHMFGHYSMAVSQANWQNEDRCQLESGHLTYGVNGRRANRLRGVFVGIYDGHGGTACSQFVLDNLFRNLRIAVTNNNAVNPEVIEEAYERTEHSFMTLVRDNWHQKPELASTGSCCLVGVVYNTVLYVANAGDSRAVLAKWPAGGAPVQVIQLSAEHNAKSLDLRRELQAEFPDDPHIVKCIDGCWRVRGKIQVTRAIGDVYLKSDEFNREPLAFRFRQPWPIVQPILKAQPTVQTYQLTAMDRFIIFASDGLWEELTNEDAVTIVRNTSPSCAAKVLLKAGLDKIANKQKLQYEDFKKLPLGERRYFHDDISIVILFLDNLGPADLSDTPSSSSGTVTGALSVEI